MTTPSSSSKAPCGTCGNKATGIFRCEGCLEIFCRKHLIEHRDLLSHQLDEIVLEHDALQQTIVENRNRQNQQHPVLKEIDQWEKNSIVKIQRIAEEARQQVRNLTNSQTVSKELHDLAEGLQKARADDDYVETDLHTWTSILQKLRDDINMHSSSISIQEDQTEIVVGKLYISTPTMQRLRQREAFGETFGNIRIEDNGHLAVHHGPKIGNAFVRGVGEYSSGEHYIRFLVKKNSTTYESSFIIISKFMSISEQDTEYKGYGWWSDDKICCAGVGMIVDGNFRDLKDETTFEIELQLDCDNQKISYVNQRTKNRREMNVDMTKCPFPWQVEFYLFGSGDCIQLLP